MPDRFLLPRDRRPRWAVPAALAWTAGFGGLHLWWCFDTSRFVGADPGTVPVTGTLIGANLAVVALCLLAVALLRDRVAPRPSAWLAGVAIPLLLVRGAAGVVDQALRFSGAMPTGLAHDAHYTTGFAKWTGAAFDVSFLVGGIVFLAALGHLLSRRATPVTAASSAA